MPKFEKSRLGDKPDKTNSEIIKFLAGNFINIFGKKKTYSIILLGGLVGAIAFFEPYLLKLVVDTIESSIKDNLINYDAFIKILIMAIIFLVIHSILHSTYRLYFDRMLIYQYKHSFVELSKSALGLSYSAHLKKDSGAFFKIFQKGLDDMFQLGFFFFLQLVKNIVFLLVATIILFNINPILTFTVFIPIPFMVILAIYFGGKTRDLQKKSHEIFSYVFGLVSDSFTNIGVVKIFTNEKKEIEIQDREMTKSYEFQKKVSTRWTISDVSTFFFISIGRILVSIVGVYLVINNEISLGTFILFFSIISWIYFPIQSFFSELRNIQYRFAGINDLLKLLEEDMDIDTGSKTLKNISGEIEFKNVEFEYTENTTVFKNLSFKINPGETVAFVGGSGGGKSTITSLLYRFYDIKFGSILLDGININDYTKKSLRYHIGMVMQDNTMFNTTVLNNLIYSKPNASESEIKSVIKKANAEFIYDLENGLNTEIGERGLRLSGGQKQRLAIARVLLSDPEILILDEATSALDNKSEHIVQEALDEVMVGRTTIVIAHRLSTVKKADRIFVLENGNIVESGKFEDLEKKEGGALFSLINSRSEGTF